MTHAAWVMSRQPDAPEPLRACVVHALRASPGAEDAARGAALVDAACLLLRGALRGDTASRARALDLLSSDAAITYAFEAIAGDPRDIEPLASLAMAQIASVVRGVSAADIPGGA